jgi:hypothetical protein
VLPVTSKWVLACQIVTVRHSTVNVTILLRKLIDIEKSIGKETRATILERVFDAENCLLEMQREMIEMRTESKLTMTQSFADVILGA